MKFFLSLNGKTGQKATKTAFVVCSMQTTFLKEVVRILSLFNACAG